MTKIDTQYTREITCPWCGHKQSDSWEWDDHGEEECGVCWMPFIHSRFVEVSYCTEKKEVDHAD